MNDMHLPACYLVTRQGTPLLTVEHLPMRTRGVSGLRPNHERRMCSPKSILGLVQANARCMPARFWPALQEVAAALTG